MKPETPNNDATVEARLLRGLTKTDANQQPSKTSPADDDARLAAYIDGTLSQHERLRFEQQLAARGSLRARWIMLQQVQQEQARPVSENHSKPQKTRRLWPALSLAACVILIINLGLFYGADKGSNPATPGITPSEPLANLPVPKRLWQIYLGKVAPDQTTEEQQIWRLSQQLQALNSQPCLHANEETKQLFNRFIKKYPADFSRFQGDYDTPEYWCTMHQRILSFAQRIDKNE